MENKRIMDNARTVVWGNAEKTAKNQSNTNKRVINKQRNVSKIDRTVKRERLSGVQKTNTDRRQDKAGTAGMVQSIHQRIASTSDTKKKQENQKTGKKQTKQVHKQGEHTHPADIKTGRIKKKGIFHKKRSNSTFGLWKAAYKTFTVAGKTIKTIYLIYAGLLLAVMVLFLAGSAIFHNFYTECRKQEYRALSKLDTNTFKESGKTLIYDADREVLATLHNTGYKYVKINEISEAIQNTYISSEDKEFLEHNGFSLRGIARAGKVLLQNDGRITQGGSTITQQLVKNTLLDSRKTFARKLTEIFLAVDLEKKFTKADIMEYYLNVCFYGNNCKGIYAASEYYFGKKPSEINYKEAAMLAAISKSPSIYNPEADYDRSIEERNVVLKGLKNDGIITKTQYKQYVKDDYSVRDHETRQEKSDYRVSFAVYCGARRLMKEDGFRFRYLFDSEEDQTQYEKKYKQAYVAAADKIRNGGFSIYTSFNSSLQDALQKSVDDGMKTVSLQKDDDGRFKTQASGVCIDNSTGYVVAIVGGRGTEDEYNRAFLSSRQSGSAIKPVVDYGPAFDTGTYFPSRIVTDEAVSNGPKNAGGGYQGNVTIRYAIADSINTVAYQTLQNIGVNTGLKYLKSLEFSSLSYLDNVNSAIAIGGFTNGVKNYELAGAYAAIENGGVWREPTCITNIKSTLYGVDIKDSMTDRSKQVYKSSTAYLLTSCMQDVLKYGTGKGLGIKGQTTAGKTGTTNNLKDGWFCGYTPYYTSTIWVGNDDGTPLADNYGATFAGKIWHDYMTKIHKDLPEKKFDIPDTVEKLPVGIGGAPASSGSHTDWFAIKEEETATVTIDRQRLKEEKDAAEKAVKKFEDYFINSETDAFKHDDLLKNAEDAVSACEDDDVRNEFLERIQKKETELQQEMLKYTDLAQAKKEYEKAEAEKRERDRRAELAEQAEDNRISNATNRFNEAYDMINNSQVYSDALQKALNTMKDSLSVMTRLTDYNDYVDKYNDCIQIVQQMYDDYTSGGDNTDDTDNNGEEEAE